MPQIQPYESNVVPTLSTNTGQISGDNLGIGSGITEIGQGVDKAVKGYQIYQAKTEATDGDVSRSQNNLELQTKTAGMKKSFDASDPNSRTDFFKEYDAANAATMSAMKSPQAREYLQKKIDTDKDKYWEIALRKNSQLAGQELGASVKTKQDLDAATVYLDPSLVGDKIKDLDSFIANIPASTADGHADQVKQQMTDHLVQRAAEGEVRERPYDVVAKFDKGEYPFSYSEHKVDNLDTLYMKAKAEIRARESNARLGTTKERTLINQAQKQNHQDLYSAVDSGTADFRQLQDAEDSGNISPVQHTNLQNRLHAQIDGAAKGDPTVIADAYRRLRLPDGDPNKITDFEQLTSQYNQAGKGIDARSLQTMGRMYLKPAGSDSVDPSMFNKLIDDSQKQLIQPTFVPWGDRQGMSSWAKFMTQAHSDYETKMKTGNYTPQQLLDPGSKDYIGKSIPSFKRSPSDMSAQATYLIHGPVVSSQSGTLSTPPVGTDPNKTPVGAPSSAFTPEQMEVLKSIGPQKKGGK